jgi:hypothetical protein
LEMVYTIHEVIYYFTGVQMRRFFRLFTILLTVFLVLMAGAAALMEFGSIGEASTRPSFLLNWGITGIPFSSSTIVFPQGDAVLIQRAAIRDVSPGKVVLYYSEASPYMRAARADGHTESGLNATAADGSTISIPAANVVGLYRKRIPYLVDLVDELKSWLAVSVFASALILSIILWRTSPKHNTSGGNALSPTDEDIASTLY